MELVNLKEIALQIRGVSYKQNDISAEIDRNKIILLKGNNIQGNKINWEDLIYVNENKVSDIQILKKGDLLLTSSSGSKNLLGKHVIYTGEVTATFGAFCKVVRPDKNKIFPKYLDCFFKSKRYRSHILKVTQGANINNLRNEDIDSIEIPFPSYGNQIRIAYLLEKIEATIAERKNAIGLLDEFVKANFYQMFGDPVKNEKEWSLFNGFEYANDIQVGVVIKPASHYVKDGVIALRSLNIKPNKIDLNDVVYFSEVANKTTLSKSILKKNDIVLVRTGNTGVAAIIPDELDGINCIDLIICRPKRELINSYYLVYLYNSERFQKVVENNEVGGVHKHLNVGVLKNINLPIPPINLQNQFADIAQKIESIRAEQEVQLKDLEELYASVSQKVFAGDIDLSQVPFDVSLLPNEHNPIETSEEEPKPDGVKQELLKEEIKKVTQPATKRKLNWENVSFKEVANYIQNEFNGYYFNAEMLLRYLKEDIGMVVNYFSSVEQKKKPQYENADDFYRFVTTAITGENSFLQLEQVFYNAETENIPNISFTETDLVNLAKKDKKERSGIYFRIKDEITTP
ncbi:restriction endonuclease subunit S [Chryseobacterium sediminis]|uniref:Type I restriction modification DNA specificity domain-containing protein n=1 Tax=Chryseobacterium sediminis TaxID=1679494 RepID=A0A5B2TM76_9FLAO|nr:restriction endonuclease subunit S [Chryseobacterium sediminis]KAA2215621.1 hypothetical protein FW780_21085 [Chryseobacterium sediminis]